jgi:hypothetical protein
MIFGGQNTPYSKLLTKSKLVCRKLMVTLLHQQLQEQNRASKNIKTLPRKLKSIF